MEIRVITVTITRSDLAKIARDMEWSFVKAVVDVARGVMAIGGTMHVDEESLLLQEGSKQEDLWGINLYPELREQGWLEFDSMINVRPWQNNRSRGVEDAHMRSRVEAVVKNLVQDV
ncbi:MAG TPA: DUF5674 family protein [Candidatus Methylomirabilis sp.]|nr:DUF5674 family protein [Candidatus Methylomirabilis sp.]